MTEDEEASGACTAASCESSRLQADAGRSSRLQAAAGAAAEQKFQAAA